MRALTLLFASLLALALAAACGGQTNTGLGDGGSSSSSGGSSSSGASSSGGSTSGSSSGGVTCAPLPGCNSALECPESGGCGVCYCEHGGWACTGCGDDVSDAYPVEDSPYGVCPLNPPNPGTLCDAPNASCSYGSAEGCGESCDCQNGTWECFSNPCPPPLCPQYPPPNGSLCNGIGSSCLFPVNDSCGEEECDCDPSGTWGCYDIDCFDGGPPSDAGIFDSGPVCPGSQPAPSSPCDELGNVCSYFTGCETNCLCASSGWVCATQQGCNPDDF